MFVLEDLNVGVLRTAGTFADALENVHICFALRSKSHYYSKNWTFCYVSHGFVQKSKFNIISADADVTSFVFCCNLNHKSV